MTAEQMWNAYIAAHPEEAGREYDAWCFGGDTANELAMLTAKGIKTATASAYPLYAFENEQLPKAGEYSVILRTDGTALCVIKTNKVTVVPFCDVTPEHAYKEGEGDRSIAYWRMVHEEFFTRELAQVGMAFTEKTPVVCEEFEVVYSN